MKFGETLDKQITTGPGYLKCVVISCCIDICYKSASILVHLYPFINIFQRFKNPKCQGYFALDLYINKLLGIFSICVMLYGIKSCCYRDLYSFNNFRFALYIYIILQTLYVFYLVLETVLVDCAEQTMKYRILTSIVMLLLGGLIIGLYNTFWLYILDLASEKLHEVGNRNYSDELKNSDPKVIFGEYDETEKLAKNNTSKDYGTLNADIKHEKIPKNPSYTANLTISNDILL